MSRISEPEVFPVDDGQWRVRIPVGVTDCDGRAVYIGDTVEYSASPFPAVVVVSDDTLQAVVQVYRGGLLGLPDRSHHYEMAKAGISFRVVESPGLPCRLKATDPCPGESPRPTALPFLR